MNNIKDKKTLVLKVFGMDCAEEIAILKKTLLPDVLDETKLTFDLLNGKLTIETDNPLFDDNHFILKIKKTTGMDVVPWEIHLKKSEQPESFWQKNQKLIMTCISGLFLLMGFLFHAFTHGFFEAFVDHASVADFPILSTIFYALSIIVGGWFIFPKAFLALKHFRPDMNLLMTIAVVGAAVIGQWFESAIVVLLFSLALLLETWTIEQARKSIRSLLALTPNIARLINPATNEMTEKNTESVLIDELISIRPHEKIPLDGIITEGQSHVNQAPITGESMPVYKEMGSTVFAGTVNGDGHIIVRVTKIFSDTTLSHIIKRIEEAQAHRAHAEQWVDTFARYYTPSMIVIAALICIVPPLFFDGQWMRWFYEALVILVIACPCALVISTPVSIVAGLSRAAKNGILIKGGIYLELPAKLKAMAFDKTGTITQGKPKVYSVSPINDYEEIELLRIAASLESYSTHPIAHAITERAKQSGLTLSTVSDFQAIKGKGAEGYIDKKLYWIGSHRLLHEKLDRKSSKMAHDKAVQLEKLGQTVVILGKDNHALGLIAVSDPVKSTVKQALEKLRSLGIKKIVMLTGDNQETAKAISDSIGITDFKSELLPEDKINYVKLLKNEYGSVAMIGDGVNDAPAMAEATLGIAMGAIGSDAAIETADIALMTDDLTKIPWLLKHSKNTLAIIKQNISFAIFIKIIFLSLAIANIATLWMAIAADTGASLIVIANAMRLLRSL